MAEDMTIVVKELMRKPEQIRNIGIVAHIDHGKTTLSDNLLAGTGMMSQEDAGHALKMDFIEQEQERGITIYAANVSMVPGLSAFGERDECDAHRTERAVRARRGAFVARQRWDDRTHQ